MVFFCCGLGSVLMQMWSQKFWHIMDADWKKAESIRRKKCEMEELHHTTKFTFHHPLIAEIFLWPVPEICGIKHIRTATKGPANPGFFVKKWQRMSAREAIRGRQVCSDSPPTSRDLKPCEVQSPACLPFKRCPTPSFGDSPRSREKVPTQPKASILILTTDSSLSKESH